MKIIRRKRKPKLKPKSINQTSTHDQKKIDIKKMSLGQLHVEIDLVVIACAGKVSEQKNSFLVGFD